LGAKITTPAKNGVFTDLFVVIVPIIGMLYSKKKNTRQIVAALITFFGATIVLDLCGDVTNFNMGDVLSIICGVIFAIQFVVMENFAMKSIKKINPYNFTVIQLFVVSILALIVSLALETKTYISIDWENTFIWLVYLCVCATGIAYLLQFLAQTKISAETTAALSCSESIFTFVFSVIFGFDKVSYNLTIGFIIMISGMLLSSIPTTNKRKG
jgi:drug/metabolite transporter (DMT)-like permease